MFTVVSLHILYNRKYVGIDISLSCLEVQENKCARDVNLSACSTVFLFIPCKNCDGVNC
jgi:hypothetical protein